MDLNMRAKKADNTEQDLVLDMSQRGEETPGNKRRIEEFTIEKQLGKSLMHVSLTLYDKQARDHMQSLNSQRKRRPDRDTQ